VVLCTINKKLRQYERDVEAIVHMSKSVDHMSNSWDHMSNSWDHMSNSWDEMVDTIKPVLVPLLAGVVTKSAISLLRLLVSFWLPFFGCGTAARFLSHQMCI
jgi:hypothetical protein